MKFQIKKHWLGRNGKFSIIFIPVQKIHFSAITLVFIISTVYKTVRFTRHFWEFVEISFANKT